MANVILVVYLYTQYNFIPLGANGNVQVTFTRMCARPGSGNVSDQGRGGHRLPLLTAIEGQKG